MILPQTKHRIKLSIFVKYIKQRFFLSKIHRIISYSIKIVLLIILFFLSVALAKIPIITTDNAKAFYIVDGDSISLSMRIKGIDTPEKQQKCAKIWGKIVNCGTIAKEYLRILLDYSPGKLRVEPAGIGYYGRILAHVYKGEVNIGRKMVEQGMAWAYGNQYKTQEARARVNKIGFWGYAEPPLKPRVWRKKHLRKF